VSFGFTLDKAHLSIVRRREGRYLLRSNLTASDPAQLWRFYLQLSQVEAAFKNLKRGLAIRPIFHQRSNCCWRNSAGRCPTRAAAPHGCKTSRRDVVQTLGLSLMENQSLALARMPQLRRIG
jgi:hypothetical protein